MADDTNQPQLSGDPLRGGDDAAPVGGSDGAPPDPEEADPLERVATPAGNPAGTEFTHRVIARNGLLVRSGPAQTFPVIRSLPRGTPVNVLKRSGEWALVDEAGDHAADGFVHLAFLDDAPQAAPAIVAGAAPGDDFIPVTRSLLQTIMDRCAGAKVSSKLDLDEVADALTRAMLKAQARNRRREVAFLSQSVIETDFFRSFAEYKGQTRKYAPFYGRGLHQLTLKETYAACSTALYGDDRLVQHPDLILEKIDVNIDATAWYWRDYKPFNRLADARNIDEVIHRLYGHTINDRDPKVRESVLRRRSYYKTIDGILDHHSAGA